MKNLKANRKRISCILFVFLFIIGSGSMVSADVSSYSEPTTLLQKGSRGTGVKWLQDNLNQNGYSLAVDGSFGNKTYQAVIDFQSKHGLAIDGIVGSATRNALKSGKIRINQNRYVGTAVHLRSGAGTNYHSYGVLERGTQVYVYHKTSDGWAYVKWNQQYGYIYAKYLTVEMDGLPVFNRSSTTLLGIIQNCKAYYAKQGFAYSTAAGVRSIPADKSNSYSGKYYTDCSTFVSWSLYEYALANGNIQMKNYFSTQKSSSMFASIGASGGNSYLSVVSARNGSTPVKLSNARAGDILVTSGHVEFLSSYTKVSDRQVRLSVYNCGSNASLQKSGVTTSGTTNIGDIQYILRVK